jgi:LysR family hca operon transcriptional activator
LCQGLRAAVSPGIEIVVHWVGQSKQPGGETVTLADALMRGKLDVAFMRPEARAPDLIYRLVRKEPLVAVLPSDHRLASREAIDAREIASETFISVSHTAPTLRIVIDDYLKRIGLDIRPDHEVDNIAMAMSLVASTRGVALLPAYVRNFMPWSVISRPIMGDPPTIDLVIGYSKANASPTLKLFLSRADELIGRVSKRLSDPADEAKEREESRQETREKTRPSR